MGGRHWYSRKRQEVGTLVGTPEPILWLSRQFGRGRVRVGLPNTEKHTVGGAPKARVRHGCLLSKARRSLGRLPLQYQVESGRLALMLLQHSIRGATVGVSMGGGGAPIILGAE